MKTMLSSAGILLLATLCSRGIANGPVVSDKNLNFTLTLPDGFEPFSEVSLPPDSDFRYVFRRKNPDGDSHVCVFVRQLRGVIGRKLLGEEAKKKYGVDRVYLEKWKSFDVEVAVTKVTQNDLAIFVHAVQVPIIPRAIQLEVVGAESQDAELIDVTRALLSSLDGPTNWLTEKQASRKLGEATGESIFWIIGIGAAVYGLTAWRTSAFRKKVIKMGFPVVMAIQKIRPSWVWYLLPAYLLFASSFGAGMISFVFKGDKEIWYSFVVFCLGILASLTITGVVMWRRGRTKRRMLSNPPPFPAQPDQIPR